MNKIILGSFIALGSVFSLSSSSVAATIQVTITNLTTNTVFSPVSNIFHDGSFDNFNLGEAASEGIERIAEDANVSFLNTDAMNNGFFAGTVGNGPITGGTTVSQIFDINPIQGRYLNFASMLVPSNDAFIGNDNPTEYEIFDINGRLISQIIEVPIEEIWDAGTEINDELSPNAAIPGQPFTPGSGEAENGVVSVHPGYVDGGNFEQLGFTSPTNLSSPVVRITITSVPEPTTIVGLLTVGGLSLMLNRKKQKL